jgi:hypothetical protein
MSIEGLKIYGVCLKRLQHQIKIARERIERENLQGSERIVLESYRTGDIDEIIDIRELFDVKEETHETVHEKLKELARDVSLMVRETVEFDFSDEGHLCLY